MIKPSDCTIIIPHLGASLEAEYALDQCLESLKETFKGEIIVAHNGQNDCKHPRQFDITAQGQCLTVNAVAATVNTPWIFVTNDDMIYAPGWFGMLTTPLKGDELCISPMLIEPKPGAPTFEVYFCGGAGGDFDKEKFYQYVRSTTPTIYQPLRTGFNLPFLISKELWDLVGGYDINFDPWGSNGDSDLEYKIRLAGVQPYQNTNCIVYHFSQTSGTFHPDNQSYWQKNWDYFIEKWGFPRTDEGIWEANFVMPDKERIFRPEWEGKYGS